MITVDRVNALDRYGISVEQFRKDPYAAMKAAGGLFGLRKVSLAEFSGAPANPDLHVVVRTDTGEAIGQVGNNYECFPNEAFFGPIAEALIEAGAEITRFQMLDNGTRSFMRFSWPEDYNLRIGNPKVGDIVGRRAILSTSHDGKYAGKFSMQMLRLACSNGMTVPVGTYEMNMVHTIGGKQQLVELSEMIPTIETHVQNFNVAANILADTPVKAGSEKAMKIITRIADPKNGAKKKSDGSPNLAMTRISRIADLFAGQQPGADNKAVKDTGWGLYNAAVDFFTHERGVRGQNDSERQLMQRFKSLLPGGPANQQIVRSWHIVTNELGVSDAIAAAINN